MYFKNLLPAQAAEGYRGKDGKGKDGNQGSGCVEEYACF